ncbi:MFS transporter [Pseudomonas sp. Cab53]|jgi:MHS family proline/betaine transporter-like MFS transporter|uniref:Putative proline/betaine transporter, membrane protein n=1 Tax=Pseudomonas brassicacearum (strain NFM421) TaxID=994484 RepID=F2KA11_PSEBN|nr:MULTISPECIES: MFS transporter [Pseudomonas]AEA68302.1 putative proline/betaine transporter, membrane protein [Pseudomonas brassicacearum subsp. brassicacearum NFM421]MCS3514416.1 MHS family proline/betaine transporter-like MFS transporter [Pseudomonas grimontii]OPG71534.1 MFS transporter [Pseudomonas ogarae]OPG80855.1 MFS transporter [Pseudomonas ogarae]QXH97068.1 MFS transporter [Pseudomonas zarinae]
MTKTKTTSSRRSLAAGAIGNFGEIYDFAVFGFSIPILSVHFFPGSDRTAALLSTFAVYAVAFVARPLGGLMFGYLADRLGRIRVMAMTVWLMALGTAIIGLLPTYATIGIAAPLLLLLCRIAQGLALGGETTGSTSYIVESAPENRRGYWLGFTLIFSHLPNAVVAGLVVALQLGAGDQAYSDWAWRIPFLLGGIIGVVGFWLRRNIDEPEEYKQARQASKASKIKKNPLIAAIRCGGLRGMLHVFMVQPVFSVGAYLLLGFMYTFLIEVGKLDSTSALISNAIAVIVLSALLPLGGLLSDRFGRKRVLTFGAAWIALSAYPAMYLAASGSFASAVAGQTLLAAGLGIYGAASFVAAAEFFPTSFRATGHAISYQTSVAMFGGTCPLIAAYLSQAFGSPLAPAFYVTLIAVLCLITTQFVPETRGINLRTSVGNKTSNKASELPQPQKAMRQELST